jgi:prevent-host-death family protein
MPTQFNLAEAKAKLSELLDRALAGEEIIIARAGEPLAKLMPVKPKRSRKPGAWRGWGDSIPTDAFLAPMDPDDLDAGFILEEAQNIRELGPSPSKAERLQ